MKMLAAGLQDHLDSGTTTLCWCWRLTRSDGLVLGFSDHDKALMFDGTYFEASCGFNASEIKDSVGLNVDNLDVSGALKSNSLNDDDLVAGYFDDASVEIFRVNWADVSQRVLMRTGNLGEIKRDEFGFTAEIRGLSHYLQQPMGRVVQFSCDADLGDSRCGVDLIGAAFTGTAVVSEVIDDRTVKVTGLGVYSTDWFTRGLVRWTIGENLGQRREVKRHALSGAGVVIELWQALALPIAIGDQFDVTAGCDKQFSTCREKYSNAVNFRGFPNIPGNDFLSSYPNRDDPDNDGASR